MAKDPAEIHASIVRFLITEFEREEARQTIKIDLLFAPPGETRRDPLRQWHRAVEADRPYFEEYKKPAYPDRLASEIMDLAENCADSYGMGKHRFKLISFHALGGERSTFPFTILPNPETGDNDIGAAELTPSAAGIQLQLMRHLENQQKLNKDMIQSFVGTMREVTATLRDDNERLHALLAAKDKERHDIMAEIEEARSKSHDQQIEAQLVMSETSRKEFTTKKIMGLLPVALSRILEGREGDDPDAGGGQIEKDKDGKPKKWKPSPLAVALGEIAAALSDDQMEIIRNSLSIEQQIMLSEAIRLAKKGGSLMLPQIVADLAGSLERETLSKILGELSGDQQQMFVRAMQLAKAEAEPAAHASKKSGSDAPANGVQ